LYIVYTRKKVQRDTVVYCRSAVYRISLRWGTSAFWN